MANTEELMDKDALTDLITLDKVKSKFLAKSLLKILSIDKVNGVYRNSHKKDPVAFIDSVLAELNIKFECSQEDLNHIPSDGPFVALANHPYGGIDGLILMSIFLKKRPDLKVLVNYMLQQFPELVENTIAVDPFERKTDTGLNIKGIKKSLQLLQQGTPIGVFPAGEVSAMRLNKMKVSDKIWNPVVGKLISKSGVKVVPVYFSGHNSLLFHLLGLINPQLRTAKLPSELFNKNQTIKVRIGKPISTTTIKAFEDNDQLLRFLRAKTYSLGSALDVKPFFLPKFKQEKPAEEIIDAMDKESMNREVSKLREGGQVLFDHQDMSVCIAGATDIPNVLKEISRLREITFRQTGEGTNKSEDTDEFDIYYKHLFIWDNKAQQIVGAYRIGEGAKLFSRFRKKGFYLNQLFKFDKDFNPIFKSSLELGRSFIVKEYQRSPFVLMLLWKGINEFVKQGNYKYLIGPVSISNSFSGLSKDLMVDYILKNHFDETLASYVRPRKKYHFTHKGEGKLLLDTAKADIKFLDQLIADIEPDQAKIPVLVKKYLMQNAKIIAFNVDPHFNNSLDGLLILKLDEVPESTFKLVE